jgi:hypothetical protein
MLEIVEKKIARDDPAYLKIISELNRWLFITHEELLFKIWIWLALHQSKALETSALIYREYQNYMVRVLVGVSQLFCGTGWSWPDAILNWDLNRVVIETFDNEESRPSSYYRSRLINYLINISPIDGQIKIWFTF